MVQLDGFIVEIEVGCCMKANVENYDYVFQNCEGTEHTRFTVVDMSPKSQHTCLIKNYS